MQKDQASKIFECLSSGVRLDIWRCLIREGESGMVAGELAKELGVAPNSLSFHLKNMAQAELIAAQQEGRFQRYRANVAMMNDLLGYLTDECCVNEPSSSCGLGKNSKC